MADLNLRALARGARRIDAATPAGRDRAVDALRALAIAGVVFGHWLVTAIKDAGHGRLLGASPLQHMPWLTPVSWLLQTLAVFFFVGGHVGAKSWASASAAGIGYGQWLGKRLSRLFGPVVVVLVVWAVAAGCMLASGVALQSVRTLLTLVLSPLWFLLVLTLITAVTPLVARLHPVWPLAVVAVVDLVRFGFGGPAWLGWANVAAGWLVPYCLGAAWGRGALDQRRYGLGLFIGGAVATAALVLWGGYPASMVGVPGAPISNLNPPTLAAVTFGSAQCGLAVLVREPLRRAMRRPMLWAAVALVNLSAMTVFLWHQTAMLAVTITGVLFGPLHGLHTAPDGPGWVLARICWLPVFAAALAVCWGAFHTLERGHTAKRRSRAVDERYRRTSPRTMASEPV
ncbi:acyltransferase family protein [Streptomyces sp. NPDC002521]